MEAFRWRCGGLPVAISLCMVLLFMVPEASAQKGNALTLIASGEMNLDLMDSEGPLPEARDGILVLQSDIPVFPYLHTKRDIFTAAKAFELSAVLRFSSTGSGNAGLMVGRKLPKSEGGYGCWDAISPKPAENIFRLWCHEKEITLHLLGTKVFVLPADGADHTIQLRYDGRYRLLVDGKLVYTSGAVTTKPTALWLGNPCHAFKNDTGQWPQLEIATLHLQSLP
jgi:hypothetical protein